MIAHRNQAVAVIVKNMVIGAVWRMAGSFNGGAAF
jgi:hypothetical protein